MYRYSVRRTDDRALILFRLSHSSAVLSPGTANERSLSCLRRDRQLGGRGSEEFREGSGGVHPRTRDSKRERIRRDLNRLIGYAV